MFKTKKNKTKRTTHTTNKNIERENINQKR